MGNGDGVVRLNLLIKMFFEPCVREEANYYELFGIKTSAHPKDIEKAFRDRLRLFSEENINALNNAELRDRAIFLLNRIDFVYGQLVNPKKRAEYDKTCHMNLSLQGKKIELDSSEIRPSNENTSKIKIDFLAGMELTEEAVQEKKNPPNRADSQLRATGESTSEPLIPFAPLPPLPPLSTLPDSTPKLRLDDKKQDSPASPTPFSKNDPKPQKVSQPPKGKTQHINTVELAKRNYKVGKSLYEQKMFPMALNALKEAVRLDPSKASYFYKLGVCQARIASLRREAEVNLRKAADMEPWSPEYQVSLGMFYYRERLYHMAESSFKQALSYDPDNGAAKKALELLKPKDKKSMLDNFSDGLKKMIPSLFD